ncbi:MAG TPA: metallophosphoesterase [Vicinamibacterales bacterium]|nr:metallophosphoesterase [Vicinamibacterales bacterium]
MRQRSLTALLFIAIALSGACNLINSLKGTAGPSSVYAPDPKSEAPVQLPNAEGSLKFIAFGDFGTGTQWQYETATQMAKTHERFPFEIGLLLGDNLYGESRPQEYSNFFEKPYKVLLDKGVKFYAALGNHDDRNQRFYKNFNMEEKQYYTYKAPKQNVRFFVLESTYPEPEQIKWFEDELKKSGEDWKIVYMHHPMYSSGGRHGSDAALRDVLEPLMVKYNVSVVFTGHDHFYERIKLQKGIAHFVIGSGGKLAAGDLDKTSPLTARGFDTDYAFLVGEIVADQMYFNAITRTGGIMDSGIIGRRKDSAATDAPAVK